MRFPRALSGTRPSRPIIFQTFFVSLKHVLVVPSLKAPGASLSSLVEYVLQHKICFHPRLIRVPAAMVAVMQPGDGSSRATSGCVRPVVSSVNINQVHGMIFLLCRFQVYCSGWTCCQQMAPTAPGCLSTAVSLRLSQSLLFTHSDECSHAFPLVLSCTSHRVCPPACCLPAVCLPSFLPSFLHSFLPLSLFYFSLCVTVCILHVILDASCRSSCATEKDDRHIDGLL